MKSLPMFASGIVSAGAAAIISVAAGSATAARAEEDNNGFYLTLEGLIGNYSSQRTGINYSYTAAPITENDWEDFGAEIDHLFGGRVEGGWQFETSAGTPFVIGLSYTSLSRENTNSGSVYGWVYGEPPEIPGDKPEAEINLCIDGPCVTRTTSVDHKYWEVSPIFSMAVGGTEGNHVWLGLQPFYGQIDQVSFTTNGNKGVDNSLNAEFYGALLTGQKDFRLSDRNTLSLNTGLGWYNMEADGFSKGRLTESEANGSGEANGARAQLGLSLDHAVNSNFSFGAAAKLDYWSNQPYIMTASDEHTRCELKGNDPVCTPPRVTSYPNNVRFDDAFEYFLGLNVMIRN